MSKVRDAVVSGAIGCALVFVVLVALVFPKWFTRRMQQLGETYTASIRNLIEQDPSDDG